MFKTSPVSFMLKHVNVYYSRSYTRAKRAQSSVVNRNYFENISIRYSYTLARYKWYPRATYPLSVGITWVMLFLFEYSMHAHR